MDNKNKLLSLLLASCLSASFSVSVTAADKQTITIGTGGVTGVYYPAGGAICRQVNKGRKIHNIHCSAQSTPGSSFNVSAVRSGKMDIGVVQSDIQYNAYRGSKQFTEAGPDSSLRALFSLHPETFTVVARADTQIRHINDLAGKRVNIGNPGSGQRATMEALMAIKQWDKNTFSPASELKSSKLAKALCSDKIDAMVFTVGHPSAAIIQATDSCNSVLVEVSGNDIDQLIADNSYYRSAVIYGGTYRGTEQNITSFGLGATVVASSSASEQRVYELVKAVFENFEEFKALHPAFAVLTKQQMIRDGLTAPLHPGAVRYYQEAGLL